MKSPGDSGANDNGASSADLVPYLLNRASAEFNRAWLEHLRAHGVTIARWQVLAVLAEFDGSRVGRLAAMSGAEQAVTTRVVDQMERDGLVRRRPARDDGRAVEVWLTRRGRDTFGQLVPAAGDVVADALRGLDPAAVDTLAVSLATLVENLGQMPNAGPSERADRALRRYGTPSS